MKTARITILLLCIALLLWGTRVQPILVGFYQSDMVGGETVQMSVWREEAEFILFVSNKVVNTGTYVPEADNTYVCRGDAFDFTVTLAKDDTFSIRVPTVNGGEAVRMQNISSTPATFGPAQADAEAASPAGGIG